MSLKSSQIHKLFEEVEWLRENHHCQTQSQRGREKIVLAPHTHGHMYTPGSTSEPA